MRCDNCGWDNPDGNIKCEKCNVQLKNPREDYTSREYIVEERDIKKTAYETGAVIDDEALESKPTGITRCPQCGYPLRSNDDSCPECGASVYALSDDELDIEDETLLDEYNGQRNVKTVRYAGGRIRQTESTVNPWEQIIEDEEDDVVPEPATCFLKPLPRENEEEKGIIEFNDNTIVLNRENIEPDNQTITSQQQAVLRYVKGKWYVEDLSTLQTTFLRVKEPTEIKDGDILLLGDRQFLFSS